jgi:hypothetical protein
MVRRTTLFVVVAFLLVATPGVFADSIQLGPGNDCGTNATSCGPFTFTIDVTGSTVTYSVLNGSSATWSLEYFSLNLYSGNTTVTSNDGLTVHDGQGNNSQPIGGCNDTGPTSAFCVVVGQTISGGSTLTFTFNVSGGTLNDTDLWHVQSLLNGPNGTRVALSALPAGDNEVPEPASMILLGTGLMGGGRMIRKRLKQ